MAHWTQTVVKFNCKRREWPVKFDRIIPWNFIKQKGKIDMY